ncbi:hypothetical protein [Pseudoalteromonas sp. G4]|uniref:hypothetical protein n=1 Tax=Pseudoalteromonas sp. G4 TaxID=2992761 RepID=UPI00237D6555|nr:hypothetical protein [Pseudoalteromonas sp. G4]MDE3273844.1 hypothetical protein [Pseudoalteromonas sp. G4]
MINNTGKAALFVSVLSLGLIGCSESITDDLDDALTHEAEFSFINAMDYSLDFHLQQRNLATGSSGLFDSKNLAAGNVQVNGYSSEYDYDYPAVMNMVNIGMRSAMSSQNEVKVHTNLSDDDEYWVIAWQNGVEKHLTLLEKKERDNANTFNVRIFANGVYPVTLKGSQVMTTERGKVSDFLTLDNCALDLTINGHAIDLCTGDFGESYLLVVNSDGKQVLVEE